MAGRSFLKHEPNHKPPIQFQMLAAWYYISFFLVHGISLIEIGACFNYNLPVIIRNKKRGSDTVLVPILLLIYLEIEIFAHLAEIHITLKIYCVINNYLNEVYNFICKKDNLTYSRYLLVKCIVWLGRKVMVREMTLGKKCGWGGLVWV